MQEVDRGMIKRSLRYRQRPENEDELFMILCESLQDSARDTIVMRARDRADHAETDKQSTLHY